MVTALLVLLAILGVAREGPARTWFQVALAILVCGLIDMAVNAARHRRTMVPESALITGLLIGLILIPGAPPAAVAGAAVLAAGSKHLVRVPQFHILNPAAAGLLGSLLLIPAGQSWWGALVDLPPALIVVLVAGGSIVAWRVNRLTASVAFVGVYFALFTVAALIQPPSASIAALFRPPFLNACIFFALLMLTDPSTSPSRYRDQVVFGILTGVVGAAAFIETHGLHFLFIGLVVANAWFAWRRTTLAREDQSRLAVAAP